MKTLNNQSLKSYNTLGVDTQAKQLCFLENIDDLKEFIKLEGKKTIIGSGSNILIINDINIIGINRFDIEPEITKPNPDTTHIKVGSGYNRDEFVRWTLEHKYYGLENLGLIPGTVGAGALGNIGAYGSEICDFIYEVEYIDLTTFQTHTLSNSECQFAYRWSVFKTMSEYFISSVTFKFDEEVSMKSDYPDIQKALLEQGMHSDEITPKKLYEIICDIRTKKMPSRDERGTAGSFFKNPIVDVQKLEAIKAIDPDIKFFSYSHQFKLAAGYLLDKLGFRGSIIRTPSGGSVGCYQHQALLLVSHDASGREIDDFAQELEKAVWDFYGVRLEREVISI